MREHGRVRGPIRRQEADRTTHEIRTILIAVSATLEALFGHRVLEEAQASAGTFVLFSLPDLWNRSRSFSEADATPIYAPSLKPAPVLASRLFPL